MAAYSGGQGVVGPASAAALVRSSTSDAYAGSQSPAVAELVYLVARGKVWNLPAASSATLVGRPGAETAGLA
eukprot:15253315-Alexandrium_andersonii.AAC.1